MKARDFFTGRCIHASAAEIETSTATVLRRFDAALAAVDDAIARLDVERCRREWNARIDAMRGGVA